MSARDAVLDAFADLLINDGERAATLDAVAARAQVSKGGLLYHFKSRDALVDGLVERLRELAAADVAAMRTAPEGPSAYYVSSSDFAGSPLDRALLATARLAQNASPSARDAMRDIQHRWYALIAEEVGDPATARAILLIGDGLYYNAALAGGPPSAPTSGGAGSGTYDGDRVSDGAGSGAGGGSGTEGGDGVGGGAGVGSGTEDGDGVSAGAGVGSGTDDGDRVSDSAGAGSDAGGARSTGAGGAGTTLGGDDDIAALLGVVELLKRHAATRV